VLPTGAVQDGEASVPPAFDASGRYVLIATSDGTQLHLVDLSGDTFVARSVSSIAGVEGPPLWSTPAGAFVMTALGGSQSSPSVHLVDTAGTTRALIGEMRTGPISADREGRMLVTEGTIGGIQHLLLIDASGREVSDLTSESSLFELGAIFSPDGHRAIASRQETARLPGLWLIDLITGDQTVLTTDGSDPRWLP
jgi:hypothetical protein